MAALNEEITLGNGRRITLGKLLHEHTLLLQFVAKIAKGSTSDKPHVGQPGHVPGPYITIVHFTGKLTVKLTNY